MSWRRAVRSGNTIVGAAIRIARQNRRRTQEWLASRVSVTRGAIAQYETGHRAVPVEKLLAIGRALEIRFRGWEPRRSAHHSEAIAWAGRPMTWSTETDVTARPSGNASLADVTSRSTGNSGEPASERDA